MADGRGGPSGKVSHIILPRGGRRRRNARKEAVVPGVVRIALPPCQVHARPNKHGEGQILCGFLARITHLAGDEGRVCGTHREEFSARDGGGGGASRPERP